MLASRFFLTVLVGPAVALSGPGCSRSDSSDHAPPPVPQGAVTFTRDIAPFIFKNCSPCHRPTQPGPFNLLTYADVRKRAEEIRKVTAERTMPPWLPEPGFGEFKEERRLSEEAIRLIQTWVTSGAAEGNTADLPPLPRWAEGWQLGEPDLVLKIPEP